MTRKFLSISKNFFEPLISCPHCAKSITLRVFLFLTIWTMILWFFNDMFSDLHANWKLGRAWKKLKVGMKWHEVRNSFGREPDYQFLSSDDYIVWVYTFTTGGIGTWKNSFRTIYRDDSKRVRIAIAYRDAVLWLKDGHLIDAQICGHGQSLRKKQRLKQGLFVKEVISIPGLNIALGIKK